jgi:hypothetical protein
MTQTLDYSTRRRRKRTIRKKDLVIVVSFLCAVLVAYKWQAVVRMYEAIQGYRVTRAVMTHERPPGHVAYTEDVELGGRLMASDPTYFQRDDSEAVLYHAAAWFDLMRWRSRGAIVRPKRTEATIFLHARRVRGSSERGGGSAAPERLVVVEMFPTAFQGLANPRTITFYADSCLPDGTPVSSVYMRNFRHVIQLQAADRLTIFSGQPDPSDPAHFWFDYALNGARHTIDGYLRANDDVELIARE